jgi:predicted esterase
MIRKITSVIILFVLLLLVIMVSSCSFNHAFFKRERTMYDLSDTVKTEIINIKNSSGRSLTGIIFKPKVEPKATIFLLKGNSGDISSWFDIIGIMLNNGYQVFAFDYEGMGESEGRATHKNVLTDSQMFLKQLRKRNDIKEKNLILWGFSFGGNLAVKLASNNPGIFDLIIIEGAFTSQRKVTLKKIPWYLKPFAICTAKSPYASRKFISKLNDTPIIVVHSVEDKEIPYKMGVELYNKASEPKLFFEVLGDHCSALKLYETEYFQKIDKMLPKR